MPPRARAEADEFITYISFAYIRRITREEWEAAGVKGQNRVQWDPTNGYKLPMELFTEDAKRVLREDDHFAFLTSDDPKGDGSGEE